MAAAEVAAGHHDRPSRRRPFSAWMKRLTNLKGLSSESSNHGSSKRHNGDPASKSKKVGTKNNPYPMSALPPPADTPASSGNGHLSFSPHPARAEDSVPSLEHRSQKSEHDSGDDGPQAPMASNRSAAPTLATNPDTVNSDAGYSKTGTTGTGVNGGGGDSTFSSPAPSVRSLTTTLTTIQSTAPSTLLPAGGATPAASTGTGQQQYSYHQHTPSAQNQSHTHFTHQFPSQPVTAIPAHLAPQIGGGHPSTYITATANNLLTDNASVLTLASSTKRRRRHSLDTDASVRALAPSSLWGGSRESLPLSVLSGNVADSSATGGGTPSGIYQPRPSLGGVASAERASVYSSSGVVAPLLAGDRSSYYGGKQGAAGGDGASTKSGLLDHGRNDSVSGSISGMGGASPASPAPTGARDAAAAGGPPGRLSRRSSNWGGEVSGANSDAGEDPEKGQAA